MRLRRSRSDLPYIFCNVTSKEAGQLFGILYHFERWRQQLRHMPREPCLKVTNEPYSRSWRFIDCDLKPKNLMSLVPSMLDVLFHEIYTTMNQYYLKIMGVLSSHRARRSPKLFIRRTAKVQDNSNLVRDLVCLLVWKWGVNCAYTYWQEVSMVLAFWHFGLSHFVFCPILWEFFGLARLRSQVINE